MKNKYRRMIGSRLVVTALAVLLEAAWLAWLLRFLAPYALVINTVLTVLAVVFVLYVASKRDEAGYKILWLIAILTFPIFGAVLYLCFGDKKTGIPLKRRLEQSRQGLGERPAQDTETEEALASDSLRISQTFRYISRLSGYPVCANTSADYCALGDTLYPVMLEELRKAERFIYLEYFIVEEGEMWDSIANILEEKAAQGVDVRMIYDDLGSLPMLPPDYSARLEARGIKCISFNPMRLFLSGTLNNRDHRKIMVIDGRVAFSGGINLADEYINAVVKHGHWKDGGFRITGPAVQSYTDMFAEFWNAFSKLPIPRAELGEAAHCPPSDGYVLPYYDSPMNRDAISNHLYMELLDQATQYAWFFTPYLMLGDTLLDAFVRAAQRGVDVRIFMPGVPDKKIIFRISRSFYRPLLAAGVKIYEYTPGFLHAKACLVDGQLGTLGTVNLDYRSLFLHFECNALFYRASLLQDLKADFLQTQSLCREITLQTLPAGLRHRLADCVLRILAPLC